MATEARQKTRGARKVTRPKWNRDATILLPDDFFPRDGHGSVATLKIIPRKKRASKGPGTNAIEGRVFRTFPNL